MRHYFHDPVIGFIERRETLRSRPIINQMRNYDLA